jgi:hypothetical protein
MNIRTTLRRTAGVTVSVAAILGFGLSGVASADVIPPPTGATLSCAIQSNNGDFLTAVGGGGRTTDVIHTNATRISLWERFILVPAGGPSHDCGRSLSL